MSVLRRLRRNVARKRNAAPQGPLLFEIVNREQRLMRAFFAEGV